MEITKVVSTLIKTLQNQGYSFENYLNSNDFDEYFDYQSGIKKVASEALLAVTKNLVSYDNVDKNAFCTDFKRFQQSVDDRVLFAWAYKSGALSIVGIIHADDLSESETKTIFTKLDNGVTNIMRAHVGQSNGQDAGIYGTMLTVFDDPVKARLFNSSIQEYYSSHFMQCSYVSSISIDCKSEVLTQGKAGLFVKWQGGMDVADLRERLFRCK